jgi:TPR repeat protein
MPMTLRLSPVRLVLVCAVTAGWHMGPVAAVAQSFAKTLHKAQTGNAKAEYELAGDYYNGTGIATDPRQGFLWLRKSAAQDYEWADKALGVMYRNGVPKQGVPKDPHEAALWFRKAARQKNEPSQTALTQMVAEGVISKEEADWHAPDQVVEAKTATSKPFSLAEVEKGLSGGITCKRLATLIEKFKVDFTLTTDVRERLSGEGADDGLLTAISAAKRSL